MALAAAERIAEHVRTCAACQAQLATYDEIDTSLRMQRVPVPAPNSWQSLRARLRQQPSRSTPPRNRLAGGLAVAAAVVLVVGGFAELFTHLAVGTKSGQPNLPPISLDWQPGNVPAGIANQYALTLWRRISVAWNDAATFYGCETPADTQSTADGPGKTTSAPTIWVSHDGAQHWGQISALPIQRADIRLCYLTLDTINPDVMVAVAAWPPAINQPDPDDSVSFVSYDAGVTWQPRSDPRTRIIIRLATLKNTTYAQFDGVNAADQHLMVSTDQMQTWHSIDQAIAATGQRIHEFEIDPNSGAILAQVGKDGTPTRQLWTSQDGGHTWTRLPAPTANQFITQAPQPGKPWTICAIDYDVTRTESAPNRLYCSSDGGQHWRERPGLNGSTRVSVPVPQHPIGVAFVDLVAITNDGTVIVRDDGPSPARLYRLAAGASQWQSMGALPLSGAVVGYSPGPGSGILWAANTGHQPVEPRRMIFTARYS